MLEIGIKKTLELTVTDADTAATVGSGLLPVFATPRMIALMEQTASEAVAPYLEEGQTTVGTLLNVRHLAATPVGMKVFCAAELTEIDRKRLVFTVTASDECGPIGEGTHERFIVDGEKFLAKTQAKLEK
ncbi:MAG: thioesterase family protein [Clostridia bacterium]|nr:thioesterase family protein [Clostridia bacterium]